MYLERAIEIINRFTPWQGKSIFMENELESVDPYVSYRFSDNEAYLDGSFTSEQLMAIATYMNYEQAFSKSKRPAKPSGGDGSKE